jgi:hypothetical protein
MTLFRLHTGTWTSLDRDASLEELIFSLMCCLPGRRVKTFPDAVTLYRLAAAFRVLSLPPPCLASTVSRVGRDGRGAYGVFFFWVCGCEWLFGRRGSGGRKPRGRPILVL